MERYNSHFTIKLLKRNGKLVHKRQFNRIWHASTFHRSSNNTVKIGQSLHTLHPLSEQCRVIPGDCISTTPKMATDVIPSHFFVPFDVFNFLLTSDVII